MSTGSGSSRSWQQGNVMCGGARADGSRARERESGAELRDGGAGRRAMSASAEGRDPTRGALATADGPAAPAREGRGARARAASSSHARCRAGEGRDARARRNRTRGLARASTAPRCTTTMSPTPFAAASAFACAATDVYCARGGRSVRRSVRLRRVEHAHRTTTARDQRLGSGSGPESAASFVRGVRW